MKTAQAQTIEQNQMQEATKIAPNVNVISGIIGDDILVGIPQIDVIDGDAGRDILLGSSGNDALSGGPGGDFIYGGAGGDVLDGDNGEDILFGGDDIDAIGGGSGGDAVNGGSGSDALSGNQGNDALHGSNGNDAIYGNEGEDVLFGDKGNDVLNGGDDGDTLYGNTGNDFLNGDNSNDILFGGSVNDVLYASQGRDTLSGGAGVDVFVLLKGGERDIIKDFVVADDTILISAADFGSGLTPGAPLESNQFVIGATANDASDRFIYDATNGALFFDMDGIGKTGQQQIATLHKPCKIPLKKKRSPNFNQGKTMSKENLAQVMEQMQLDPSLQQKQVAATNADVLNSTKFGGLEDRQIKSSSYSLGKLIEWKRIEDTMKSIARRTTLALFGWALVIGAAMPASAGSPDVKNIPAPQYEGWVRFAGSLCDDVNGPLLAAQIEQESNWNPLAVSPAGAEGMAQFKPEVWAKYGVDANRNGTASVWEQEDAILSQGFYMCVLAVEIQNVPADRTTAMLWAYNAGPEATKAANGAPPTAEADNYARRILDELIPKYRP